VSTARLSFGYLLEGVMTLAAIASSLKVRIPRVVLFYIFYSLFA
jgi:hypothetical protein